MTDYAAFLERKSQLGTQDVCEIGDCREIMRRAAKRDGNEPFSKHPELRLDISNGRTLCKACHLKTDTWGFRAVYPQTTSA